MEWTQHSALALASALTDALRDSDGIADALGAEVTVTREPSGTRSDAAAFTVHLGTVPGRHATDFVVTVANPRTAHVL